MKKKLFYLFVLISVMLVLTACGKKAEPVAINEAADTCDVCNMAVVDNQFAAQTVLENGKSLVFDDIGCMYNWLASNKNEKIAAEFVRDYNNKEWILTDSASYVYNESIKTPMAYNMISFKDQASAKEFAAENKGSKLMTAGELTNHNWIQNRDMMNKHKMENHSHLENTHDMHSEDAHSH